MNLEELAARESIRDLVARYNFYGDTGRITELADLFLPDGEFELDDGTELHRCRGRAEITALLESIKQRWVAEARDLKTSGRVFHSVGTHVIDVLDSDHARGHAYVSLIRSGGLAEWGRYLDEYQRTSDGWRFSRRRVFREGEVPLSHG